MGVGKRFRDEQSRYEDPLSGCEVTCLTNWLGHSWQFCFTHPCWIDEGRAFLFHSERDNASNYFCYELATGEIVQLMDLLGEEAYLKGCLCPATGCFYYWSSATARRFSNPGSPIAGMSPGPASCCIRVRVKVGAAADPGVSWQQL